MKLLEAIGNCLHAKKPCYQCGQRVTHLHKVRLNAHGLLTHVEFCDECFAKVNKGKKPPAAQHA